VPAKKPVAKPKPKPKPRAARGTGTVFWCEAKKRYVARKPIGKRGRHTLYVARTGRTQAEAIRRRDRAAPPGDTCTLAEWVPRWLESLEVKEQSRDGYRACVEARILPQLGHVRVPELTAFHVEEAARAWGRAVAAGTVRKTLAVLSAAVEAACRADVRDGNPATAVRRPRAAEPKLDLFTPDELGAVVRAALAEPRWRFVALLAATGARVGEALAARPTDYDPATGAWRITGTLTREHGIGTPKSRASVRTIGVPTPARPAFDDWQPPLSYTVARQRWLALLRSLGLRARGLHQLRHTVASHAIADGVPLANVARDLGDTVETLVRVYLHPTAGRGVCDAMEGLLGAGKVPATAKKPRKSGRKRESR
jgi:integrase